MRESQFIHQNRGKWYEFEKILREKQSDPDQISSLFIQVTEDLSFARTYYPNRSVRFYLNQLSQRIFGTIYRNKAFRFRQFWSFWSVELPFVMYRSRRQLLLSLMVFTLAFVMGVFSSAHDNGFARMILGDGYVEMTRENIRSGDPMAVYKGSRGSGMFLAITLNNIRVAFMVFIFGVFLGIGSIYILLLNGMMIGAFHSLFAGRELLPAAILTIWQHGTIEISSVIIAGAAGITLGHGLVFPGTYTRIQAFRISAYRGIKILLGTVPLFIIAGFIESFITRHTQAPVLLRILVIALSAAFILYYYLWLPWSGNRKGLFRDLPTEKAHPPKPFRIKYGIQPNAEIIKDGFTFLKDRFPSLLKTAVLLSGGLFLAWLLAMNDHFSPSFSLGDTSAFSPSSPFLFLADLYHLFNLSEAPWMLPLAVALFTWMTHRTMKLFARYRLMPERPGIARTGPTAVIILLAMLPFFLPPVAAIIISLLTAPLWLTMVCGFYYGPQGVQPVRAAFRLLQSFYFRMLFLVLTAVFIALLMLALFSTPLMTLYIEFVLQHISTDDVNGDLLYLVYLFSTGMLGMLLLFSFLLISALLKKRSLDEMESASSLIHYFERMGTERRAYGFIREE